MMRSGAPRALFRPLAKPPTSITSRATHNTSSCFNGALRQYVTGSKQIQPLALTTYQCKTALIRSYATGAAPGTSRSSKKEAQFARGKLQPDPDAVSTTSSMHPVFAEQGVETAEPETDMMAGIRHDVKVIRDTFALSEVPTEPYRLGLAGVLPYLATSAATVACAFDLNYATHNAGYGLILNERTAELLLHVLEPIQVGYGAVILSFLGAIHWGMEWAGYGGHGGYKRYLPGVLAPAIAWPTIMLPVEHALIIQFLAFNVLYAVDSSASKRGWLPPWYSTYRFILTFIVGASIVVSLIGRGQVQDRIGQLPTAATRVKQLRGEQTGGEEAAEGESEEESEEE